MDFQDRCNRCNRCNDELSQNSRPIFCKHCKTVHCEKCWIVDEKYHFCPWCFHIPLGNKRIVYYPKQCGICLGKILNDSNIVMQCGHGTHTNCQWNIPCSSYLNSGKQKERRCGICKKVSNEGICTIRNVYTTDKVENKINTYDLFPLYKYLLKQKIFPMEKVASLIMEYRKFMRAKVVHQDWNATILSPASLVDTVWHTHLLISQDYIPFCKHITYPHDQYIHHNPFGEFEDDEKKKRYTTTVNWLFGIYRDSMNLKVWCSPQQWNKYIVSSENSYQIYVTGTNGKFHSFNVISTTPVWILKVQLQHRTGICLSDIRLIYAGKSLDNVKTLGDYRITKNTTLDLVLRIRGC